MKGRWINSEMSTLVTGGFTKVEDTLFVTGNLVEVTYQIFDTFVDDGDDEWGGG